MKIKFKIFRYFVLKLYLKGFIKEDNDYSRLKIIQLFFQVYVLATSLIKEEKIFINSFEWKAYPLGPKEEEIHEALKEDYFKRQFKIDDHKTTILLFKVLESSEITEEDIDDPDVPEEIKNFINAYLDKFPHLFEYGVSELIQILQKYKCWENAYNNRTKTNVITLKSIQEEKNIYVYK
jgi:hypothetical protein